MMLLFYLACTSSKSEELYDSAIAVSDRSGEELLEEYNSSLCDLYMQESCREGLAQCNAPTGNFSDWADCMNSQLLSQQHCAHLPILLEEHRLDTEQCINSLIEAECSEICQDSVPVYKYGSCETIASLLVQNCSGFGP
ncbi:MAG: hypothetical protein CMK59_04100 [Proteobacteria bacterium]|nr:hypothetical protein [Pseudomonadota bacterium]